VDFSIRKVQFPDNQKLQQLRIPVGLQAWLKNSKRCHSERSEESLFDLRMGKKPREILRFAQNDNSKLFSQPV
jgi:hypothetical protein